MATVSIPTIETVADLSKSGVPGNTTKEMDRKRAEYFAGGAKLVWEVFPQQQIVKSYTAAR